MDLNSANVRIQFLIKEQTAHGEFNDALYYTPEEFAGKTEDDIHAERQQRVDAWVAIVSNPQPAAEPTPEELARQAGRLQQELNAIYVKVPELKQARIEELTGVKAEAEAEIGKK